MLFLTAYSGVTLDRDLPAGTFDWFRSLPVRRAASITGGLLASAMVIRLGLASAFIPAAARPGCS
ncbi:MAG TPA: hypothetical protein VMV17_00245 [Streptosporangiaceae bacterium]|nr:hypothetical protein [Streptosporangiaceae bacterium]